MASVSKSFLTARNIARASSLRWVPEQPSSSFVYSYSSAVAAAELQSAPPPPSPPPPPLPTSSSRSQDKQKGWTRFLLFVPGAITFGLGTWQIYRRQEKVKMLEYKQSRLQMEPINCNYITPSGENLDSLEFRRVVCKGVYDDSKSIYVGPTKMPILVNRGWVPRSWRDKSIKILQEDEQQQHPTNVESTASPESNSWWRLWSKKPNNITEKEEQEKVLLDEVVGVIRGSEKPSIFVPANDPNSFQWFYVDVDGIARCCGVPEKTIYIEAVNENVNPSNPYPIPKDNNALIRSSVMPQDHLNYTITWYSLSAAVTFMAFKRLQPKKKMR